MALRFRARPRSGAKQSAPPVSARAGHARLWIAFLLRADHSRFAPRLQPIRDHRPRKLADKSLARDRRQSLQPFGPALSFGGASLAQTAPRISRRSLGLFL